MLMSLKMLHVSFFQLAREGIVGQLLDIAMPCLSLAYHAYRHNIVVMNVHYDS